MEDHSLNLTPLSTTSSTSSSSSYLISPRTSPSTHRLTVKELSFTLHRAPSIFFPRSKLKPVEILKSVSFSASSAELLAIVGPSGAGKSTLLRILSGRARRSSFTPRSISLDGETATSPGRLRRISGLVPQEDNLLPLLTVKETLMFSAKFRLQGVGKTEREDRVQCLMNELGLLHIADAYVGDAETRGISGGRGSVSPSASTCCTTRRFCCSTSPPRDLTAPPRFK
ncbi:hypothetical protein HPP92_013700 [Vanilla planifolia]|uniref:ABC transporter domain-containing protein n=1 Tax=Vanilla planifolia TaxID=51239 RepID=A0A835UV17_VANPL|nr:hypothetical protein HPP92_013700 [Vanilla planifolia]